MEEIRQQARFARMAFHEIKNKLITTETERLFFHVDAFLFYMARIQVYFREDQKNLSVDTSRVLNEELKWDDEGPLKRPSLLSEILEQPGRFLLWLGSLRNTEYVDMNMMPIGTLDQFGSDDFHRNLDPETLILKVRDLEFDLKQLEQGLKRVEVAVDAWLRKNHPW